MPTAGIRVLEISMQGGASGVRYEGIGAACQLKTPSLHQPSPEIIFHPPNPATAEAVALAVGISLPRLIDDNSRHQRK